MLNCNVLLELSSHLISYFRVPVFAFFASPRCFPFCPSLHPFSSSPIFNFLPPSYHTPFHSSNNHILLFIASLMPCSLKLFYDKDTRNLQFTIQPVQPFCSSNFSSFSFLSFFLFSHIFSVSSSSFPLFLSFSLSFFVSQTNLCLSLRLSPSLSTLHQSQSLLARRAVRTYTDHLSPLLNWISPSLCLSPSLFAMTAHTSGVLPDLRPSTRHRLLSCPKI